MLERQWIKAIEANGWRLVSATSDLLTVRCSKVGCEGQHVAERDNLHIVPPPCPLDHVQGHARAVYSDYKALISVLRDKRRALGLSQEDIDAAAGMASGHTAKIESHARTAEWPTLLLLSQTLGQQITLEPASLPVATMRAIEDRRANPYAANMARFKEQPKQLTLLGEAKP